MNREEFIQIMHDDNIEHKKINGCKIFAGLKIITKYLPDEGIGAVGHDIVYSADIEELINAGITEEDVEELNKLDWMIEEEYDCLSHFT